LDKIGRRRRRYKKTDIEKEWEEFFRSYKADARVVKKERKDGNEVCDACDDRWYYKAAEYGLVHKCGEGLVQEGQ